jgi:hypothetical protein
MIARERASYTGPPIGWRRLIEEVPIDVDAGWEAIRAFAVSMQIVGGELARDLSYVGLAKEDFEVRIACEQASYADHLSSDPFTTKFTKDTKVQKRHSDSARSI